MLATLFYVLAGWAIVSIPAGLIVARAVRWAQADVSGLVLDTGHVNQLLRHQLAAAVLAGESERASGGRS